MVRVKGQRAQWQLKMDGNRKNLENGENSDNRGSPQAQFRVAPRAGVSYEDSEDSGSSASYSGPAYERRNRSTGKLTSRKSKVCIMGKCELVSPQ